jgi:NhaA family Na+:H+ antiporter
MPRSIVRFVLEHSLLLLAGALAALVWANRSPATYEWFAQQSQPAVNDIGMAFFFGIATVHIVKATRPGGGLDSPRHLIAPVAAAVGGMIFPALIFIAVVTAGGRPDLLRGWAIPCATDVAFSYLVAKLIFGAKHPATAFLLVLAVADDALGLGILAIAYPPAPVRPVVLTIVLGAIGVAWIMRRRDVRSLWPYLIAPGLLSWIGLEFGGLHPALALVPILPFVPARGVDSYERVLHIPVEGVLFLFALINAGVRLTAVGIGTVAVVAALVAGKPIGVLVFTRGAMRFGGRRPDGVTWTDLTLVGLAAGIGFTVSLFFAIAAFPSASMAGEMKMGALLSGVSGLIALGVARISGRVYNTDSSR